MERHGNVSIQNFESIRHGVSSDDVFLCMVYITVLEKNLGESEIDDQSPLALRYFYDFAMILVTWKLKYAYADAKLHLWIEYYVFFRHQIKG